MQKDSSAWAEQYAFTQNRELSWLRFNRRVLEEAADTTNPLLERLKFIAIFSSNLDEFFMVRVGSLFDISMISPEEIDNKSGMTSEEQLCKIYDVIPELIRLKEALYASILSQLDKLGISDLNFEQLKTAEQKYLNNYFKANILPILSPIIVGSHHPVPHLANKCLYIATSLKNKKGKRAVGFIPVPQSLPPYVRVEEAELRYVRIETILLQWAPTMFGSYLVEEACILSVTRNADISFDSEKFDDNEENFRSKVAKLLKKRDNLSVIRMEIGSPISEVFQATLVDLIQVEKRQVFFDTCPLNLKFVHQLEHQLSPAKARPLLYRPYRARWPEDLRQERSIMEQIQKKDNMLFFPFDSVSPLLRLLSEAADREDVLSIKITIYRLASSSKIAHALCRAAENGKEVIVLMELRARFDEANNISWSKLLEDAGCQVIYGIEDFKCHSKICLITMRSKGKLNYITQIGTGNYNEKTNAMYTDLSIMTASQGIGEDGTAFFKNMLVNNLNGEYKQLLVAPNGIKSALCSLIAEEIAKGPQGYICIKANSITEREVIDKLKEASQAGVEVQLIIRGICCILPGVSAYTDNIQVTNIVGRFLEHARIYCFGRDKEAKLYISSADLMTRNLNRRVEIACPICDDEIREQLQWILSAQLQDTAKASFMLSDGTYHRKGTHKTISYNSQESFMELSPHKHAPIEKGGEQGYQRIKQLLQKLFGYRGIQ